MVFMLFAFVLFYGNAAKHDEYFLKALFLSPETFFLLSGLLVPYILAYALPLGLMAGTLLSFGRLSANKEIVAMQAGGLSVSSIASPVFLLALLATSLCLVVNLNWAPQARAAFEERKESLFFDNIDAFLLAEKQLEFAAASHDQGATGFGSGVSRYVISVSGGQDGVWNNLRIWFLGAEGETLGLVSAESGEVKFEATNKNLQLRLNNADYQWFGDAQSNDMGYISFREHEPISLRLKDDSNSHSLKLKTLGQLIDQRNKLIAENESSLSVDMRIHQSFSMAFAPLSLCLLAVPLAIRVGRRETMFNAGLALVLSLVYFFFIVVVPEWLERFPSARPDLLAWAPNVLFPAYGLVLFRRIDH
jgi:lipopolysaccharide export system permease protein